MMFRIFDAHYVPFKLQPLSQLTLTAPLAQGSYLEGACRNRRGGDAAGAVCGGMGSSRPTARPAARGDWMRAAPKASPERGGGTAVGRDGEVFAAANLRCAL